MGVRSGCGGDGDAVAEGLEALHEAAGLGAVVAALAEPVDAEVFVDAVAREHGPRRDDDGLRDGDVRLLRSSAAGEPAVLIRALLALPLGCADIAKVGITEEPEHQLRHFPEPPQGAECFVA